MLFNSLDFAIFLPIVFLIYWSIESRKKKYRNIVILIASYFFYAWWDWRFLFLIVFNTAFNFTIGSKITAVRPKNKKSLLILCIFINLVILAFFKYYNFFINNLQGAFSFLGVGLHFANLDVILPIGISFYTFQSLSYVIDIYKQKISPAKNTIAFFAFVSFFPQLVAGPIERASHLLPQFYKQKEFNYVEVKSGLRQILWGLFKKMVVADNCAIFADEAFDNTDEKNASALILGVIFFSFQIYGDFSGYSDIAIGTAKMFGFTLTQNFAFPYFSRNIAEFWRRWHISLTSWLKDYVYIPLGGSRHGKYVTIRNVIIIFTVSGLWHGANWTFVFWGIINAIFFLPLILTSKNKQYSEIIATGKIVPSFKEFFQILSTFFIVSLSWILFRAENIGSAYLYVDNILSISILGAPNFEDYEQAKDTLVLILILLVIEWFGRHGKYALENIELKCPLLFRWIFYSIVIFSIGMFTPTTETPFLYFKF